MLFVYVYMLDWQKYLQKNKRTLIQNFTNNFGITFNIMNISLFNIFLIVINSISSEI